MLALCPLSEALPVKTHKAGNYGISSEYSSRRLAMCSASSLAMLKAGTKIPADYCPDDIGCFISYTRPIILITEPDSHY